MRKLVTAALMIAVLVLLGWLSFHYDGHSASANLDTAKMRNDTQQLIEKGEAAVDKATDRGRELMKGKSPGP